MILLTNSAEDLKTIQKICSILDYSGALVPNATAEMVRKACEEAKRMKYAAVPVFPAYIPMVAEELNGTGIAPQVVVGFPSGGARTSVKVKEAEQGIADGAREIDMVINIGFLVDGEFKKAEEDIRAVVDIAKQADVTVKVIIETGFLSDIDKIEAVEVICNAGANFVKTCTGFADGKATIHDIALLYQRAKGRIKVKASGGVWTLEDAAAFIEAGAERVAGRYSITHQLEMLGIDRL
ncbi:deoxyribose-phosphate aldolase [Marispirochaeta sp.]|uniref:deoxyribose-phosphate aldolase n=1 Tax=Marispirochaeta sp. TaxID=2038653 RepID=UPI0029C90AB6|nr:deoxyribose-phosphate aldolase [Marispirochaeta sp.]